MYRDSGGGATLTQHEAPLWTIVLSIGAVSQKQSEIDEPRLR